MAEHNLRLRGGFNGVNIKVPLRTLSFKPINVVVGSVLGYDLTVPIKLEIGLYAVLRGDMAAEFTATASANAKVQGGADYSNGNWTTVKSINKSFDLSIEKTFNAGSSATLSPFAAEADLKIFDAVGAHFSVEPGFIGTYGRTSNPSGLNVNVSLGVTASANFHAKILGIGIDKDFPNFINEQSGSIYSHFFPDATTGGTNGTTSGTTNGTTNGTTDGTTNGSSNGSTGGGDGLQYNVWRGGSEAFNRDQAWAAQSFIATSNTISWISFNGGDTSHGRATTATVFVYSNSAMTNQVGSVLVTISPYSETLATFASPLHVSTGQRYWAQIHTGEAGKPVQIYASKFGSDYTNGIAYYHDFGGSTIPDINSDLNMRIHQ